MDGIMDQYVQIAYSVMSYREVAWKYANNAIDELLGLLNSCLNVYVERTSAVLVCLLSSSYRVFLKAAI